MDSDECKLVRNATFREGVHVSPALRADAVAFQYGLFIWDNTCLVLFLMIFLLFKYVHPSRKRFYRLHVRPLWYVVITHLGASMSSVTGSWYDVHELPETVPCALYFVMYFLVVPCLVLPEMTQLFTFYRSDHLTQAIVNSTTEMQQQPKQPSQANRSEEVRHQSLGSMAISEHTTPGSIGSSSIFMSRYQWWKSMLLMAFFVQRVRPSKKSTRATSPDTERVDPEQAVKKDPSSALPEPTGAAEATPTPAAPIQADITTDMRVMRFLQSSYGSTLTFIVALVPFLLTVFVSLGTNQMVALGCWGCFPNTSQEIVLVAEAVFALSLLIIAYRINVSKPDPFGLINEMRMMVWLGGLPALICLILGTTLPKGRGFKFGMIIEVFLVIYCFVQSVLQCILALRDKTKEDQARSRVQMTKLEFEQQVIHENGPYHSAFAVHLAAEHGFESLAFILGATQWEKVYYDIGPRTSKVRAKKLMNMYVGNDSVLPCNLPEVIVKRLREQIETSAADDIKSDFFQPAKEEILGMLYSDSFRRFVRKKAFQAIAQQSLTAASLSSPEATLASLITTPVAMTPPTPNMTKRRSVGAMVPSRSSTLGT